MSGGSVGTTTTRSSSSSSSVHSLPYHLSNPISPLRGEHPNMNTDGKQIMSSSPSTTNSNNNNCTGPRSRTRSTDSSSSIDSSFDSMGDNNSQRSHRSHHSQRPLRKNRKPLSNKHLELSSHNNDDDDAYSSKNKSNSIWSNVSNGFTNMTMTQFKLLLLILMVLQNSCTVLVGRYTRAGIPKEQLYSVNHLVMIVEVGKFILSCAIEQYTLTGSNVTLIQSLKMHNIDKMFDSIKIIIPSLLYLVQNTLLYVALSNLTAPIFQVTYQAKLVTTAIVSVLLLNRQYNIRQWICLVLLSLGVAIVVLGENSGSGGASNKHSTGDQNLMVGLTSVSIACFSSALAGVYFEMVLKNNNNNSNANNESTPEPSLWMRNIQLSFFSMLIAALQSIYNNYKDGEVSTTNTSTPHSYFHGFTFWVWVLVTLQAGGGLLVAAVIKYADNVLKGLATGVSVVVATVVSVILFNTPLSQQFTMGAILILTSVYYFSNPLPKWNNTSSSSNTATIHTNTITKRKKMIVPTTSNNDGALSEESTKALLPK